jgi:hypothetical protein
MRAQAITGRAADDVRAGADQFPACDHLRDDEAGAKVVCKAAEGEV